MAVIYQNLHPHPLFLSRAGAQVAFPPGGYSPDPWWSRHVGPDFLSRVVVPDRPGTPPVPAQPMLPPHYLAPRSTTHPAPSPPRPTAPVQPRASPPVARPPPSQPLAPIEEETDTYERRRGIYICRVCQIHRTGQLALHDAHVARAHPNHVSVPPRVVAAAPPTPPAPSAPPQAPAFEQVPTPSMGAVIPATMPANLPLCKVCAQQGVEKRFKNTNGLIGHLYAKHGLTEEQHEALPEPPK